jgi:hypothetical protein
VCLTKEWKKEKRNCKTPAQQFSLNFVPFEGDEEDSEWKEGRGNFLLLSFSRLKIEVTYFKKCLNCSTEHEDHLNPRSVCLKSLMMNPSSHGHRVAPGPPKYEGGGLPSWTHPRLL